MVRLAGQGEAALSIGGFRVFSGGAAGLSADLVLVAEVKEIHGFADIQQAVGIIREAPLFAGVVEIRLDEKVRTQRRGFARIGPPPAEALLPLGSGPVRHGGDLARQLHARVRRHAAVVEAAVPVGIHHQHLALRVAHGDAVGMAPRAAADGGHARDSLREQHRRGERLHAAHAGPDAGVEAGDAEAVQQAELRAHHVVHRQDGEARGVHLAVGRVDAAGACRAVAAANDVCADDVEAVRVEGGSRADEPFPPAGSRVGLCGMGVGGGREAGVEEDDVGAVGVELAPCFVGDVEGGEDAAPVEEQRVFAVVVERDAGRVRGLWAGR